MNGSPHHDVIIIGAGAAGLMCAIEAGKRGRRTLLIDHSAKVGEKIRISGGGRCNFTNLHASPKNFISQNPHFCVSALKRYTQQDFIRLVEKHGIAYHEKTLGQLFCDGSSQEIIDMLLKECAAAGVEIRLGVKVAFIRKTGVAGGFEVGVEAGVLPAQSLVIATGGLSIPKMGATDFGYEAARQFGISVVEPRAALVPFVLEGEMLEQAKSLAGVSLNVAASTGTQRFEEGMVFTHRGLSGPAILQISSYWNEGGALALNLAPGHNLFESLKAEREAHPKQEIASVLSRIVPKRLAERILADAGLSGKMADLSNKALQALAERVQSWRITPAGTEGFRTAEVTLGGVDTNALSSKTMEAKSTPGLYFIGEVVDVTGHLGGFNFQWAWSSGHAAGQFV